MLLSFLLRLLRLEEQKIKATKLGNSSLDSLLCHPPKLKNSIHPPFKKLNELPAGWNVSTSSWLWRKNAEWIRGTGKGTVQFSLCPGGSSFLISSSCQSCRPYYQQKSIPNSMTLLWQILKAFQVFIRHLLQGILLKHPLLSNYFLGEFSSKYEL